MTTVEGWNTISVKEETRNELSYRKDKMKWKKHLPKLTWDEFLLVVTNKLGDKHEDSSS